MLSSLIRLLEFADDFQVLKKPRRVLLVESLKQQFVRCLTQDMLGCDRFDSGSFAQFFEETVEVCFAGFYE